MHAAKGEYIDKACGGEPLGRINGTLRSTYRRRKRVKPVLEKTTPLKFRTYQPWTGVDIWRVIGGASGASRSEK